MAKIITIHSFGRAVGKSNITVNLATLLAMAGHKTGVIDANLQSPILHSLFGLNLNDIPYTFNDYLHAKKNIYDVIYDLEPHLKTRGRIEEGIYLIPASPGTNQIAQAVDKAYDLDLFNEGLHILIEEYDLDALIIDTHAGLDQETMLAIAISDLVVIVLDPNVQQYQGTSILVDVAKNFNVPQITLVVNKVPSYFELAQVERKLKQIYNCEIGAVLPKTSKVSALKNKDIFVYRYPYHLISVRLKQMSQTLI